MPKILLDMVKNDGSYCGRKRRWVRAGTIR
jgi:hypothetical protein